MKKVSFQKEEGVVKKEWIRRLIASLKRDMCAQQKLSSPDQRVNHFCPVNESVRREESKLFEFTNERHSVRLKDVSVKEQKLGDV